MPTNIQYADGRYNYTQPWWTNANDREMYDRAFSQGNRESQLEALALICADAQTRNREIRTEMTAPLQTPQSGVYKQELTINDVLAGRFEQQRNAAPTDFSGTPAGQESTAFPSLPTYP